MLDPSGFTLPYDRALCRGLIASGASVTLFTRPPRPGERAPEEFDEPHFHRAGESAMGRRLPERMRLVVKGLEYGVDAARWIARSAADPPDVVHLQWMPVPLLDRAFVRSLRAIAPVVATVHDTRPFRGSPSSKVQELGWEAALRAADRLIVHTESSRDALVARGFSADRISLVPHGLLAAGEWASAPAAGPLRVLLFGALKPYKGLAVALAAMEKLPDGVELHVVGTPRMDLDSFRSQARVHWDLRWVPDAEAGAILAAADVHLFPYLEVDASGALLTVLGRGAPVIASRVGGPAELLSDGRDALLVPPGDVAALARAIERLMDPDLRRRLAEGGRITAKAVPEWDEIGRRTLDVYAESAMPRYSRR
jgi:glycosyltransferase involved in cell wall biosynthesis